MAAPSDTSALLDRLLRFRRTRTATLVSAVLFLVAGAYALVDSSAPPQVTVGAFFLLVGVAALYNWTTGESVVTTLRRDD